MKLPKEINTVTPFSKIVALILFISLPIMFFFMGMQYQANIYLQQPQTTQQFLPTTIPTPSRGKVDNKNWNTYTNKLVQYFLRYPENW